jgi:hypothetical protein
MNTSPGDTSIILIDELGSPLRPNAETVKPTLHLQCRANNLSLRVSTRYQAAKPVKRISLRTPPRGLADAVTGTRRTL